MAIKPLDNFTVYCTNSLYQVVSLKVTDNTKRQQNKYGPQNTEQKIRD